MAHVCCLYTEKFALEVAYRETRPPFWDALISRYRRLMTNGEFDSNLPGANEFKDDIDGVGHNYL